MLALLFPGQGSQQVGMGRDAFDASAAAREAFEAADDALGFSLSSLCFEGPEEDLRRTEIQQPAILATSIALLRALEEKIRVDPAYLAGHSLGEYTALVAAGALRFEDAVRLVYARGRFMQQAVPDGQGAMAAVMGCGSELVSDVCRVVAAELAQVVAPANFNSPQQTVIAGDKEAVEAACAKLKESGAKRTFTLPVSAPFHSSLMEPAAAALEAELAGIEFSDPRVPIVSNVEAAPNASAERLPVLLREQVTAPVRFTEMVSVLVERGVDRFLEVGPGRVLSGLVARIQRRTARGNVTSVEDLSGACAFLGEGGGT